MGFILEQPFVSATVGGRVEFHSFLVNLTDSDILLGGYGAGIVILSGLHGAAFPITYNQTGQVARQQQTVGEHEPYQLIYTYNLLGALTSEQYPSNRVISYAYDEGAHLSGISGTTPGQSPRTYLSNLSYAAHGGLLSATMGNGAVETLSYNSRLQPTSISLTRNNAMLQRYDYQYGVVNPATGAVDASKNTGQVASIEGSIGAERQWQQRFSYDSLGRLSQTAEFTGDTLSLTYRSTYDYDRFGNRYQKQTQNPVNEALPYTPVEDQHIDKQTNRFAAGFGLAYDAAGNVTADSKFRGLKYEYDANGRQWWSAPLSNPTNAAVAVYDGVGQRVQMSADGVTTIMVYDIYGQLVAEYGGQASGGAGGVQYVMSDAQGSTRAVLNGDGVVTARHDYQAFGVEIGAGTGKRTSGQRYSVTDSTRQRYAGMEQEGELSHTWFRKYEHQSGRWTSPDPYNGSMSVGEPQSFNRYSYVQNDPVNLTDQSGLVANECGPGTVPMVVDGEVQCVGVGQPSVTIHIGTDNRYLETRGADQGVDYGLGGSLNLRERLPLLELQDADSKDKGHVDDCNRFANSVRDIANSSNSVDEFLDRLAQQFLGAPNSNGYSIWAAAAGGNIPQTFTSEGMKQQFVGEANQPRHFIGAFLATVFSGVANIYLNFRGNGRGGPEDPEDVALNHVAAIFASRFVHQPTSPDLGSIKSQFADSLRKALCEHPR